EIDAETGQLATSLCPKTRNQVFIAGTQPVEVCTRHGGGRTVVAGWESSPKAAPAPAPVTPEARPPPVASSAPPVQGLPWRPPRSIPVAPVAPPEQPEKKKGFFGRLKDIFK